MIATKAKLIIFDIDGTLADRDTNQLLPGVVDFFEKAGREFRFALASNQGGVGLRLWMETEGFGEPEKFPTEALVQSRIADLMNRLPPLGDNDPIAYISYAYQSRTSGLWSPVPAGKENDLEWLPRCRKPAPGLLIQAMNDARVMEQETLMVGDSTDDQGAAEAAGCHFEWAYTFFGRNTAQDLES